MTQPPEWLMGDSERYIPVSKAGLLRLLKEYDEQQNKLEEYKEALKTTNKRIKELKEERNELKKPQKDKMFENYNINDNTSLSLILSYFYDNNIFEDLDGIPVTSQKLKNKYGDKYKESTISSTISKLKKKGVLISTDDDPTKYTLKSTEEYR